MRGEKHDAVMYKNVKEIERLYLRKDCCQLRVMQYMQKAHCWEDNEHDKTLEHACNKFESS